MFILVMKLYKNRLVFLYIYRRNFSVLTCVKPSNYNTQNNRIRLKNDVRVFGAALPTAIKKHFNRNKFNNFMTKQIFGCACI